MPGALQNTHLRTLIAGPWRCSLGSAELLELRNATPPWPAHVAHAAHAAHAAVLGVLNVRAQIVPVLDLALLLQTAPDLLNADCAASGPQPALSPRASSTLAGFATPLYAMVQTPARLLALRIQATDDALSPAAPRLNLQRLAELLKLQSQQPPFHFPPKFAALSRNADHSRDAWVENRLP